MKTKRHLEEVKYKRCPKCRKTKAATPEFFHRNKSMKRGLGGWCKSCMKKCTKEIRKTETSKKYKREYARTQKSRDKGKRWRATPQGMASRKNSKLIARYGVSLDEYTVLFKKQGGCCAICGVHQLELTRALAVDHDHITGKIRGLLCNICNVQLPLVEDRERLEKAQEYLREQR